MSIESRLRKIEQSKTERGEHVRECEITGNHPWTNFRLYRVYPRSREGTEHKLVVKGHCDICGYDDYLWDTTNTPEPQRDLMINRRYSGQARRDFEDSLIAQGMLDYTAWPAPPALITAMRQEGVIEGQRYEASYAETEQQGKGSDSLAVH